MSTTYLIDFENVNDLGMNGIHKLTEEDSVYIVYTNNANRICLDWFDGVKAPISVVHVQTGNQSLDMHLVSFLGYLLGQETDAERRYIIVSQDSDYEAVAAFWCSRYDNYLKVNIWPSISGQPISVLNASRISYHEIAADRIKSIIKKHGVYGKDGQMMAVASLCAFLKNELSYQHEKNRLGLKGLKLLQTFDDTIQITYYNKTEWAVLKTEDTESVWLDDNEGLTIDDLQNSIDIAEPDDQQPEEVNALESERQADDISASSVEESILLNTDHNDSDTYITPEAIVIAEEKDEQNQDADPEDTMHATEKSEALHQNENYRAFAYGAMLKAHYPKETAEDVADVLLQILNTGTKQRLTIYNSFLKKFGRQKGTDFYNVIKWIAF